MKRVLILMCLLVWVSGQSCAPGQGDGTDDGSDYLPPTPNGDGGTENPPTDDGQSGDDNSTSTGYRKLTLTGTVHIDHNEASLELEPNQGMTMFQFDGNFSFEFWFPMSGGNAVKQRCNMTLVEGSYTPLFYGTATECTYAPVGNAYTPESLTFEASLTLDVWTVGEPPNEYLADDLVLKTPALPNRPVNILVQCPGGVPGTYVDMPHNSLVMYWYYSGVSYSVVAHVSSDYSFADYPLIPSSDAFYVDMPQQRIAYDIVGTLDE